MLDLQNGDNEESSTDTVITDSGIGSKAEVDTLWTDESCTQSLFTTESFDWKYNKTATIRLLSLPWAQLTRTIDFT